jgi:hypothetical protein
MTATLIQLVLIEFDCTPPVQYRFRAKSFRLKRALFLASYVGELQLRSKWTDFVRICCLCFCRRVVG